LPSVAMWAIPDLLFLPTFYGETMKRRLITLAGVLYVTFALLSAHSAVGTITSPAHLHVGEGYDLGQGGQTDTDSERSDNADAYTGPTDKPEVADDAKSEFVITVYSASWCGPCAVWKRRELPALLKAGYKVKVLDVDEVEEPKYVKAVPTVVVSRKGKVLEKRNYWKAADIIKYIEKQLSLKG